MSCTPSEPPAADGVGSPYDLAALSGALIDTSSSARLLCLGEVHGSTADAALRSALITHPEFPDRFGQVLFEGASAAHQELLDRYVLKGEEIAREQLAPVWRDAGRGLQWRLPVYRRLLDELRALNVRLPVERRVRLLGGAPPIPWGAVQSPEDLAPWIDRAAWLHEQMRGNVAADRATLAVFGRHHCERLRFVGDPELEDAAVSVLSVGPAADAEFRRMMAVAPGDAALILIDDLRGRRLVRDIWGEGHLHRGSRFGEIADAVLSYGELEHRVLVMREEDLSESDRLELRRRDGLMAAAAMMRAATKP